MFRCRQYLTEQMWYLSSKYLVYKQQVAFPYGKDFQKTKCFYEQGTITHTVPNFEFQNFNQVKYQSDTKHFTNALVRTKNAAKIYTTDAQTCKERKRSKNVQQHKQYRVERISTKSGKLRLSTDFTFSRKSQLFSHDFTYFDHCLRFGRLHKSIIRNGQ